jgi:hypothetical protein
VDSSRVCFKFATTAKHVIVEEEWGIAVELPDGAVVSARRMDGGSGMTVTARFELSVPPAVFNDFNDLSDQRLPRRARTLDWVDPPLEPGESILVPGNATGARWAVEPEYLPSDTRAVIAEASHVGQQALQKVGRFIVWRYFVDGTGEAMLGAGSVSTDGGATWFPLPVSMRGKTHTTQAISRDANAAEITRLEGVWEEVPTAYLLLWEARALASSNARLVLTMAALEVGTKSFVVNCDPDTEWLMTALQAPPVHKILKDYIPKLSPRSAHFDKCPSIGRDLLRTIQKGVEARNALLHRGEPSSVADLDELDGAVHYCLRLFDYWAGEDWARDYLRKAWRYR